MGMILALTAADDETIGRILADPPLIWRLLAPDDPGPYEDERKSRASWFTRVFGKGESNRVEPEIESEGETDLDKSWHGIHFLLTGTASEGEFPLSFLIHGGAQIGDVEVGYGPARALRSSEVKEVNGALSVIDEQTLRTRFDPIKMSELGIYPEIWERDGDEAMEYLEENFRVLTDFINRAADKNLGIVISLQ